LLFASACGSKNDTPPASQSPHNDKPSADSDKKDAGPAVPLSDDHGCAKACAAYVNAGCAKQTAEQCESLCAPAAAKCPKETEAMSACAATSTFSCGDDGLATADGCQAELKALNDCMTGPPPPTDATCIPQFQSDSASCAGCPATSHKFVGGSDHVWCTITCTSDDACDQASGSKGIFACVGNACAQRCTGDADCTSTGSNGCAGGYCY
jgi:hypothetical protein